MSAKHETLSLRLLARWVVKKGVGLGTLTHHDRLLALRVPAGALDVGVQASEPEVNDLLKAALAGPAAFLSTDHVELRRWLVDTGWWRRDGYGRVYSRTPVIDLAPELQAVDALIAPLALETWIAQQRQTLAAERQARRQAWATRSEGPQDQGPAGKAGSAA